jgi:hypothetical protein
LILLGLGPDLICKVLIYNGLSIKILILNGIWPGFDPGHIYFCCDLYK